MANPFDDFFVRIGWDTTAYDKGAKDIDAGNKKAREATLSSANQMEAANKRAADSFRRVRNEALGLFLAFQGASSIKGLVLDIVNTNAALGRFSDNIGVAFGRVAGLRGAVQSVGGDPKDADSSLQSLENIFRNRLLRGDVSASSDLQGLGLTYNDLQNKETTLMKLSAASERMSKPNFYNRASALGISPAMINLLELGQKKFRALWEEQEKLANITQKDIDTAQQFDRQVTHLQTAIKGQLTPAITALVDEFDKLAGGTGDEGVLTLVEGGLGAVGIAVAAATWEWIVLAGAVSAVIGLYKVWERFGKMSPEEYKTDQDKAAGIRDKFLGQLFSGDFSGAMATISQGAKDGLAIMNDGSPASGGAGARTTGAGSVFDRLIQQESGGRAGAIGQPTKWGRALGASQLLPSTARAMAAKLGIPYNEALLRGKTPEALAYQLKLGRAYFDEGLSRYGGDVGKAVMFYHGGPNERMWGPKTRAYARAIMGGRAGARGSGGTNVMIAGDLNVTTPNAQSFVQKDLSATLKKRGIAIQGGSGMTQ